MYTILLVIHTIVVLFLIAIILLQRSDSDGLSGLGGGGGNLLSGRAAGNMLTRATAILATFFIVSSLTLTVIGGHSSRVSLVDSIVDAPADAAPAAKDEAPKPAAKESAPSVPKPE